MCGLYLFSFSSVLWLLNHKDHKILAILPFFTNCQHYFTYCYPFYLLYFIYLYWSYRLLICLLICLYIWFLPWHTSHPKQLKEDKALKKKKNPRVLTCELIKMAYSKAFLLLGLLSFVLLVSSRELAESTSTETRMLLIFF